MRFTGINGERRGSRWIRGQCFDRPRTSRLILLSTIITLPLVASHASLSNVGLSDAIQTFQVRLIIVSINKATRNAPLIIRHKVHCTRGVALNGHHCEEQPQYMKQEQYACNLATRNSERISRPMRCERQREEKSNGISFERSQKFDSFAEDHKDRDCEIITSKFSS